MSPTQTETSLDARGVRRRRAHFAGFELAELDYPGGLTLARHDHAQPNVTLVLRGSLTEQAACATHEARALSVVVKPAGLMHANRFGPDGARTLNLTFDDDAAPLAFAPCRRYRWQQGGREAALLLQMYREWRLGDEAASAGIESLALELMSGASAASAGSAGSTGSPPWLDAIVERLHDCRFDGVRVSDLAASAGVHPVYLARAFRRHLGCTIGVYVRRLRVEWAVAELGSSTSSLSEIALRAGFADQSHFTRTVKEQTGVAPGVLRRLLAGS